MKFLLGERLEAVREGTQAGPDHLPPSEAVYHPGDHPGGQRFSGAPEPEAEPEACEAPKEAVGNPETEIPEPENPDDSVKEAEAKSQPEKRERAAVYVVTSKEAKEAMEEASMVYEGEIRLKDVAFCKLENQQECLAGSLCIPKLLDVAGSRYRVQFFINRRNIVIIDDEDFSLRLIRRICQRKSRQGNTKERFLYNFLLEFITRDLEFLAQYERRLMSLEENVTHGKLVGFQSQFIPIRRELLILRSYYDEMMDLGRELEENENGFFAKKRLKYFGTITDRADRLMSKTMHLLDYAQQVRDAYQAQVDAQQNSNMQFLTVISTLFFPLTLITSWYGMNFENMPELKSGYPGVIILSITVIVICILIFKKKKIF